MACAGRPLFGDEWIQVAGLGSSLARGTASVKGLSVCVHFLEPVDGIHMKFLGTGADACIRGAQPKVAEKNPEGGRDGSTPAKWHRVVFDKVWGKLTRFC